MIKLERSRQSRDIPPSLCGQALIKKEIELINMIGQYKRGEITKMEFKPVYWGKAKKQLRNESFGKCAYCEAPTDQVAHGDVEHFRPKSIYWWLAYCYDNYLFSCQICNQTYKSDQFPIIGNRLAEPDLAIAQTGTISLDPRSSSQSIETFLRIINSEQAELPNPYYVDPEPFFIWKADEVLGEIEIAPNQDHPDAKQKYQAVIKCFGLNRKELRTMRYQIYQSFKLIKAASKLRERLSTDLIAQFEQQVAVMQRTNAPFAGMVRFFNKHL